MIVAVGFALFGLAVKYLPIFPEERHPSESSVSELKPRPWLLQRY